MVYILERAGCGMQACLDLKVQSQNDAKKLAEAKQLVYLKGFTDGVMLAGPHTGEKVRCRACVDQGYRGRYAWRASCNNVSNSVGRHVDEKVKSPAGYLTELVVGTSSCASVACWRRSQG